MKRVTIVGAGLVGSLWAVYLSKAGYKVSIYEKRPDIRKAEISAGKSINLALSYRGWTALEGAGVAGEIRKIAIPMYGRTMHDIDGSLTYQPYGLEGQAIYSVSRGDINSKLMTIAEEVGGAQIFYNMECIDADTERGTVTFRNNLNGTSEEVSSDLIFATDGAFSALRYKAMQKLDRFNYSQRYIEDGYREILLPANPDGSYKLDINTLHIWPRGRFMLIALPNENGSFTCTLFMPFEGHEYCFENVNTRAEVQKFFSSLFPDFLKLMPEVPDVWEDHPLSSLAIIRCYPWTHGKAALMGDAAHATVPFYGQGMNAGFQDCTVMWKLMQKHGDQWNKIFDEYQSTHKKNGDAVQDLSVHNYLVMRDFVADPEFLLQKKFELRIQELFPEKYIPLYSMVSFTDIDYADAIEKGKQQDEWIKGIMKNNNIAELFEKGEIDNFIESLFKKPAKI